MPWSYPTVELPNGGVTQRWSYPTVELPNGVAVHSGLPPMPNHGFLISVREQGTAASVTLADRRILDVYDQYDALELGSARAYLNWELRQIPNK